MHLACHRLVKSHARLPRVQGDYRAGNDWLVYSTEMAKLPGSDGVAGTKATKKTRLRIRAGWLVGLQGARRQPNTVTDRRQ